MSKTNANATKLRGIIGPLKYHFYTVRESIAHCLNVDLCFTFTIMEPSHGSVGGLLHY